MSALPYIYPFEVKIPPRWWSKRSIVQRIAIDADFEIQELRSTQSYDFDIRIWFGDEPGLKFPHHAVNIIVPLMIPMVCAKGSFIQIEVQNYKKWKLFSNKVQIAFCGLKLMDDFHGARATSHESL